MNISDILTSGGGEKHFSFEVLPPLKGTASTYTANSRTDSMSAYVCAVVRARWP